MNKGGYQSRPCECKKQLFDVIVRCFLGDLYIVHMRFAHTRRGDFDEGGTVMHLVNRRATKVAHRRTDAAHQLMNHGQH